MSLSIWVNFPVKPQFYISVAFINTSYKKKMGKMRLFVTDLLPGMFLKILVNLC